MLTAERVLAFALLAAAVGWQLLGQLLFGQ